MVYRLLLSTTAVSLIWAATACAHEKVSAPAEVSELVVTASPIAGDPDRFATIVEQVSHHEVLSKGGSNIADALRDAPGVAGTGFAAGASRPTIRGMDAQRVRLVENGLSSSDVSDVGPDHGVPIDPLAAQSIEIVRGAATLRYGSQAIGGVVNVFNNRIPERRITGLTGEGSAAYDSVSATGESTISLEGGNGPAAFHLDGFARRAGNYQTPTGEQNNSFFRGKGYSGGASFFFGQGNRLGGSATHYEAKYGIPSDDTFIQMRQDKGAIATQLKFEDSSLQSVNIDLGYADYTHSEIEPVVNEVHSVFSSQEWDGRLEAVFSAVGPLSASALGLQLQDRRFAGLGDGANYLLPTHTQTVAGFAFLEAPIGPLQVQGALRVETVRIDGTPVSGLQTRKSFSPTSLSVGFTYQVSEAVRLGFNVASAARAPAQTELFARGPHDGPLTYETGDPNLRMERANSLEATVRYRVRQTGKVEASVWRAHFENYIFGALSGRTCDEDGVCAFGSPEPLKEMNFTQRDADFWGAEIKGSIPLATSARGQLSANILGDYVRASFSGGGGNVPRIQPGRIGGGLEWTSEKLDAGFLVLAVSSQDRVGASDLPTDGYTSLDAQLAWRPLDDSERLEIMLVGHNLADETIRNATALNKDSVVMPGRNVRLVVRSSF